jgi:DNA polymerase-1
MTQTLWEVEFDFIRQMRDIKNRGIKIDVPFSQRKVIQGTKIMNTIKGDLGWNPGSSDQVGKYLIDELGLPVIKRSEKTGKPSFDKYAMEEYELYLEPMQNQTAQKVLTYRGWQKTVSSNFQAYLDLMDENQILHPSYKIHGTRTGRLSCEKPNLQQIPRDSPKPWNGDTKKAFIPRTSGLLLYSFDFKQVEFRLAAAYANEKDLLEIFNSGADIFTEMSLRLGRPRHQIKTFVYATLYGAGKSKIGLILGVPKDEADDLYEEYHGTWPGFKRVSDKATQVAKQKKYIEYWTKRRRHLNGSLGQEYRLAWNSVLQGGAFEIVKRRMLDLSTEPIVLQVHDSITCEADTSYDVDRIKRTLESVPESAEFGVKFEVDMNIESAHTYHSYCSHCQKEKAKQS